VDSSLNITIRVAGRQAQQELRAVARDLDQVQRMVGKKVTTAGAFSPWSPAIAQRHARQAAQAQRAAAQAQARIAAQSARQMAAQQRATDAAMHRHRMQVWRMQQAQHKAHQNALLRQQTQANRQALIQQKAHQAQMSKIGGLTPLGFAQNLGASSLVNAGKNINWVGRQLTYNFTLPITLAGAALMKFSLDVERSMIQVRKVYGDVADDPAMLKAELDALSKSFELLSTRFGIHQREVIDIAASWAAAGAAGVGLAEATRATLETMILGDMEAQEATEGLIAIQSQWRFSTQKNAEGVSELTTQLAYLNAIENATGISTQGLIDVIQRAGGNARTAGAELRELAALAAALVPATGGAAQAGTALRSIISSLQSPTAAATEALSLMGITVTDPSWMGATVVEKLRILSENFVGLSDAQQGVVSQFIATKWQVSRFDVLMRDIASGTGYFQKALDVTESSTEALAIRQRELLTVLESNPKKWDIMVNATRNALAKAFLPMIPAIMSIVGLITDLAIAFSNLSPETQKWILIGLTLIAVLGPLMSLLGSTMQLIGVFASVFLGAGKTIGWFINKALFPLIKVLGLVGASLIRVAITAVAAFLAAIGPIGWIIIGVIAAISAGVVLVLKTDLEEPIWDVLQSIADGFMALPRVISNALAAVVRTIANFMTGIIEALSYLNPFARHSPSLVDNVKAGVATILDEYKKLNRIPNLIRAASSALEAFSTATDPQGRSFREIELQKKADISSMAAPQAQPAANALVQQVLRLEASLPNLEAEISAQAQVVARWTAELKAADLVLEAAERRLSALEVQYESLGDAIAAAQTRIGELAETPIAGLGAMEDAIFENQHAQNLLNLELLEFERRGMTLDNIRDQYAAMAGEIETLRGTQAELRNAGAGSDILGWYDQQIAAIEAQRTEMEGVEDTIAEIERRLDALDLEKRFLELTKAINFDPLERQIDKIANSVTEMPFDEIVRQIREQQAIVAELQPQYDALGDQVERERDAVEAAAAARDGIAQQLDAEQQRLDALEQAYNDIKGLIQDMESSLNDFANAAERAREDLEEMSRIESLFEAGEGLDFPDTGGTADLGREGGLKEIEDFNKLLEEELARALEEMGTMDLFGTLKDALADLKNIDIFGPLRGAFDRFKQTLSGVWDWIKRNFEFFLIGLGAIILGPMSVILGGIGFLFLEFGPRIWGWTYEHILTPIGNAITAGAEFVYGIWSFFWDNLLQPVINFGFQVYTTLWGGINAAWTAVVGVFQWAWGIISPILQEIWDKIDGYVIPIFELFSVVAQIAWKLITIAIETAWLIISNIFNIIEWTINNIVVPAFEWLWQRGEEVLGFLGGAVSLVWEQVIEPIFNDIDWAIDNVVLPAFQWLWDEGKRIFEALGSSLQWIWDHVIAPIWDGFMKAFETVVKPAFEFLRDKVIKPIMEAVHTAIAHAWNLIAGVIESGVNFFISAFNLLAKAVNAVAGFLQIDATVSLMEPIHLTRMDTGFDWPEGFARGGVTNPAGGVYNTPHAIVGEGRRSWPEYVIPTDPAYRARALGLLQQAGTKLMADGGIVDGNGQVDRNPITYNPIVHEFDNRSIIQRAMDGIAGAGRAIVNGAVRAAWLGPSQLARAAIDIMPEGFFKGAANSLFNVADSWVTHLGKEWDAQSALRIAPPVADGPGSWQAIVDFLRANGIPHKILSTYRPGAVTRNTGKPSWHGMNRAIDLSGPEGMINFSPSTEAIAKAIYGAFKGQLHELIWGGTQAYNVFNGASHNYSSALMKEHYNHVHASLASGGRFYVPRIPGGVNLNIAEGRSGEQVQILPVDDAATGGGTTLVFYGDLSFPNITSGDDAKELISNLKALAE
jgi:TP901 family phage tail tape measure protein